MKGGNTMQEKRTLYLAGKITGDPYYFTKFYNAQKKLEEYGFIVVNPALLPAEGSRGKPICVCPALCLQSAPKSVFFRTGKRAKARNTNSAKQWRRTSRFSSSPIGRRRKKKRTNTNTRQRKPTRSLFNASYAENSTSFRQHAQTVTLANIAAAD